MSTRIVQQGSGTINGKVVHVEVDNDNVTVHVQSVALYDGRVEFWKNLSEFVAQCIIEYKMAHVTENR